MSRYCLYISKDPGYTVGQAVVLGECDDLIVIKRRMEELSSIVPHHTVFIVDSDGVFMTCNDGTVVTRG